MTKAKQKPGPKPRKGPKCVRRSLSIREDIWEEIEKKAEKLGISTSMVVSKILKAYLKS